MGGDEETTLGERLEWSEKWRRENICGKAVFAEGSPSAKTLRSEPGEKGRLATRRWGEVSLVLAASSLSCPFSHNHLTKQGHPFYHSLLTNVF